MLPELGILNKEGACRCPQLIKNAFSITTNIFVSILVDQLDFYYFFQIHDYDYYNLPGNVYISSRLTWR